MELLMFAASWITRLTTVACISLLALASPALAEPPQAEVKAAAKYTSVEDVIYGRRDANALTMNVFTPKGQTNGAGVIIFVSAEYKSGQYWMKIFHPATSKPFLERGYVVFQVTHSSQPRYTVLEIVEDAHRAVRFIKFNAKKYGIDPAKIGVAGASSGGHLSLMMGCAGGPLDPKADRVDEADRESSRAAAVACYFPPSDFPALAEVPVKKEIIAPFDFRKLDRKTGLFERVSAEEKMVIARELSPINHATKEAAPTLIIHGDKDDVVPFAQSDAMINKLKKCGVECKLHIMEGKGHFEYGWVVNELPTLADWFDIHLLGKKLKEAEVTQQIPVIFTGPKTVSDRNCPLENETHYALRNCGNSYVPLGIRLNEDRNRIGWTWKLRQK
jgi:acetyl esterase/lipase